MICNLLGIIAAFTESVFWEGLLWIIFGSGLVLSIIASIIGMLIGKRTTIHDKSETS
jgi:dipeptide/tripeptide permease